MKIPGEWHVHTPHSCDCRSEAVPGVAMAQIPAMAKARGITAYGVSDHLHTPLTLPDIEASRAEFDALPFDPCFHFGIEASCISEWELEAVRSGRLPDQTYGIRSGGPENSRPTLALDAATVERLHIEYVIGGVHWPMYVPLQRERIIRDYHRQYLYVAAHPLVDIVAHPWWWHGGWATPEGRFLSDPWLDDFGKIPLSMHDEFAACAREHGVAVEINIGAMLFNPKYPDTFQKMYVDYLAYLAERGVTFSIGCDSHGPALSGRYGETASILGSIGIRADRLWTLPPRTSGT